MKRAKQMKKSIFILSILSFFIASCQNDYTGLYSYRTPENINDGFEVGTLYEVNIDSALIVQAANNIHGGNYKEVHSMLIYKDGKLVFEEYFPGHKYKWDAPDHHGEFITWDRTMLHGIKSVSKSIVSTCIGIALDSGFIQSVHQSIFDYLPEYQHLNRDGKGQITIEHLLTMTSGLEWDEWGAPLSSSANDMIGLWFNCQDQIGCILERPLINEPGTSFTYSGGNIIVLGEIIKNATKMDLDEFSREYLFESLEIDSSRWAIRFKNGVIESAGSLEIKPRDMVKVGVTFLNNGVWNGKRIISEQWVENSATAFHDNQGINIPGTDQRRNGYSYTWWTKQFSNSGKKIDSFYGGGWGGQNIMVFPGLNTVVVFNGGNYLSKTRIFTILEKYIIPAIDEITCTQDAFE